MNYSISKKNNINIGICLCIGLLIIVISCIIYYNTFIERFYSTVGNNDYLAPSKDNISDMMWTIIGNKMNAANDTEDFSLDKIKARFSTFITKAEINYYLDHGTFQWSEYVKNRYKELLPVGNEDYPILDSPDEQITRLMTYYPNRYAYYQYLISPKMKESLTSDAYLIYSGEKVI